MKRIAFILVLIVFSTSMIAQENITVFVYSTKQLNEPTAALRSSIVGALVNNGAGKYTVVDRSDEFMKILGMEVAYQEKGFVSNKQLTAVGEQLGAQKVCGVVITDYGQDGGGYQFECNIIDVKTGSVEAHADYPNGEDVLVYQLNIINSRKVAQSLNRQLNLSPINKSSLPTFEYGGAIYMVAPDPGEPMTYKMAVNYCANLYFEGYSDWILPSEGQYNYMYFKRTIIGGFVPEYYWTNSQHNCGANVYVNTYFSFLDANIDYECTLKRDSYKFRVRPIRKVNE